MSAEAEARLVELLGYLEPLSPPRGPLRTFVEVLDACPDPGGPTDPYVEHCDLASTAAYDPAGEEWAVLTVDWGEATPEHLWVTVASSDQERAVESCGIDPSGISAARDALTRYSALPQPADLVAEQSLTDFSLNRYAPLVALGPPLEGWVLYIEPTSLEASKYRLHLLRRDRSRHFLLAQRDAERGPCDGGGWWCEAHADSDEMCTEEEMIAEGRLCVQPVGINHVSLSGDGRTLLILGTMEVAGHGGYPPYFWVAALPRDLRAELRAAEPPRP